MSFTDHISRGVSNLVNNGPGLPRGPHQMHWPDKHQGRHEGTGPRHFPNGGDKGGGGVTNALDRVVPGTSTPAPGGPPGGPGTIGDNAPLGFDRHETGFRPGGPENRGPDARGPNGGADGRDGLGRGEWHGGGPVHDGVRDTPGRVLEPPRNQQPNQAHHGQHHGTYQAPGQHGSQPAAAFTHAAQLQHAPAMQHAALQQAPAAQQAAALQHAHAPQQAAPLQQAHTAQQAAPLQQASAAQQSVALQQAPAAQQPVPLQPAPTAQQAMPLQQAPTAQQAVPLQQAPASQQGNPLQQAPGTTMANPSAATPAGNTAATAASAPAAAHAAAEARGVNVQPTAADRALQSGRTDLAGTYTGEGPQRRGLRRSIRALSSGGLNGLLVALGVQGHTGAFGSSAEAAERKLREATMQRLFWVLAIVAYGCVGFALIGLLPRGSLGSGDAMVGNRAWTGGFALIGLLAGAAAWLFARGMARGSGGQDPAPREGQGRR